jgi:putative acetyltransferase
VTTEVIDIRREPADGETARALIAALDAELERRYPGQEAYGIAEAGFETAGGVFFVLYVDGMAAGCGALRPSGEAAEIKRVFVGEAWRGRGLSRRMLAHLEAEAVGLGYRRAVLETGPQQPEALALYRSAGWRETAKFGQYSDDPLSLCFEKALAPV